ncbi:kelch-like protein 10 [Fopius arisanus]|uniref:KLHL10_0 protein n=1 Tax=Fopius arisanus TaxID=64838 RepID=A0A0C9RC58_9HYME|nr:PREDICTED: kelch-like protein 10 [Fopius arisanus]
MHGAFLSVTERTLSQENLKSLPGRKIIGYLKEVQSLAMEGPQRSGKIHKNSLTNTSGMVSSGRKQGKKRQGGRTRKCLCLPVNYRAVEFPVVWSEFRANEQFCDGIVKCSGTAVFPIHRVILSAVSPYFTALFTNILQTPGNSEKSEVSLDTAPGEIFSLILDYAYTGTCNVTVDNVEQLLPLADHLEVLGVVQLCCQLLLKELKPDNCLGIYKFTRHYFCHELEKKSRTYIRHHFTEILNESSELSELTWEDLRLILIDDDLNVRSEEIVFEALKRWIEENEEERKKFLPNLLECVRLGLMSIQYISTQIVNWKLVQESKGCQKLLRTTNAHQAECRSRPRIPYEILFAIGGWTGGYPTSFVETYDVRADSWFVVNTDVAPKAYHGLCTLDNLIYMIGGYAGHQYFNTVCCYDPILKKWHERACMYHARCYVSVCTHGGKIYALGGSNGRERMNSTERYTPERNQWEIIPPMHTRRSDASAAVLKEKIYVVGGFDGFEIFQSAEVFDVETNQWTYIKSMNNPRSGVSLIAHRNCIYAIGGYDGSVRLTSAERYNPSQADDWQEVAEMINPRSNFASVVLDGMIFVIGGFDDYTTITYVECYDADANEWYDVAPMNLNRSGFSACVLSGLSNAKEYSYLSKMKNCCDALGQTNIKTCEKPDQRGGGETNNRSLTCSREPEDQPDTSIQSEHPGDGLRSH